ASNYPFYLFILAAVMARSIRYYGLAILVALFGEAAMRVWKRHSKPVGIGLAALFVVWVGWQFKGSLPI
ncbi:MAG: DedA family protein, partial [Halomonas sp.]|nr:DedA family protein [Halomonas sp.]